MTTFYLRRPTVEAVQILSTDFNMALLASNNPRTSWDGLPFSDFPKWLKEALDKGDVWPSSQSRQYDYCVWDVKTNRGIQTAEPGDYIVYSPDPVSFSLFRVMNEKEFNRVYEKVIDVC